MILKGSNKVILGLVIKVIKFLCFIRDKDFCSCHDYLECQNHCLFCLRTFWKLFETFILNLGFVSLGWQTTLLLDKASGPQAF